MKIEFKFLKFIFCLSLILLFSGCSFLRSEQTSLYVTRSSPDQNFDNRKPMPREYYINKGDVLEISVWQIADLNRDVIVRPDGKISYPLIGEIKVEGKTPLELTGEMKERLSYFIKEPNVLVGVKSFGGKNVYVLGEVVNPGLYRFTFNSRLIELVSMAGGYTEDAVITNTKVVRGGIDNPEIISVNLAKLISKGDVRQNIPIQEGDIIYVPRSTLASIGYVIEELKPLLYAADSYYRMKQWEATSN